MMRQQSLLSLSFALLTSLVFTTTTLAGPIGVSKLDGWSDMSFGGNVSGSYDDGTFSFMVDGVADNALDIGPGGPPDPPDYGSGGVFGSSFAATLVVDGVEIDNSGVVTNGGTLTVEFGGSIPGSISDDYGVAVGENLLEGTILEVELGATGAGTMDVLFAVTGGALQVGGTNGLGPIGVPFASGGFGLLRFAGGAFPADFSQSFSFDGDQDSTTLDLLGVPEPSSLLLVSCLAAFVGLRRRG